MFTPSNLTLLALPPLQYSGPPLRDLGPLSKDGDLQYKIEGGKERLKPRFVALLACGLPHHY